MQNQPLDSPRYEKNITADKALKAREMDSTLEKLLAAFRTDALDMETITRQVELVRQDRYNRVKNWV